MNPSQEHVTIYALSIANRVLTDALLQNAGVVESALNGGRADVCIAPPQPEENQELLRLRLEVASIRERIAALFEPEVAGQAQTVDLVELLIAEVQCARSYGDVETAVMELAFAVGDDWRPTSHLADTLRLVGSLMRRWRKNLMALQDDRARLRLQLLRHLGLPDDSGDGTSDLGLLAELMDRVRTIEDYWRLLDALAQAAERLVLPTRPVRADICLVERGLQAYAALRGRERTEREIAAEGWWSSDPEPEEAQKTAPAPGPLSNEEVAEARDVREATTVERAPEDVPVPRAAPELCEGDVVELTRPFETTTGTSLRKGERLIVAVAGPVSGRLQVRRQVGPQYRLSVPAGITRRIELDTPPAPSTRLFSIGDMASPIATLGAGDARMLESDIGEVIAINGAVVKVRHRGRYFQNHEANWVRRPA